MAWPQHKTIEGIEVRYGYSLEDDLFHVHFDLDGAPIHMQSGNEDAVLEDAQKAILASHHSA